MKTAQAIVTKQHEKMMVSCAICQAVFNLSFLSTPFSPPEGGLFVNAQTGNLSFQRLAFHKVL